MGDRWDHDRRDTRAGSEERGNSRSSDRNYERGGDRYYRRSSPRCFTCNERGHFANQCRNRRRATEGRLSTSYDAPGGHLTSPQRSKKTELGQSSAQAPELQRQIEELGKNLASVSEFVQNEMAKKVEEERMKKEEEEEEQRKAHERMKREKKDRKRMEMLRKEEERVAEIEKRVELRVAIKTGEFFDRMEANFGPVITMARKKKGKKQVVCVSDQGSSSESGSGEKSTREIRSKAKKLVISEKRIAKRGLEMVFEGSPAKWAPRTAKHKVATGTIRVTCSKAKVKLNSPRTWRKRRKVRVSMVR
ncbi:hypothetical protein CBR_g34831 [Chara braunii]|uniref:CCHC-type domain-containing protein n=1 Tax=Chara braunii TaxID=69332 RepID=A0A388LJF0_CHABU|nr:hypothetical protein CBR_g34831 [Chara braunii]|eukprot:GBG82454.1 hypothetical protein CBR_g34831 [Chara braunii]